MGQSTPPSTPRSASPSSSDRFPSTRYDDDPPRDTDKSPIPYTRGRDFTVFRHVPPPPFGPRYPRDRLCTDRDLLREMTQLEYCLSAAPLGGQTIEEESFSFVITEEIAIYDPLYYAPRLELNLQDRADVVWDAGGDYTREAAAYNELDDKFGGTTIPKYYGSWICGVPVQTASGVAKRPVHLILMEFVDGVTMCHLKPKRLSEKEKSNIMIKAVEAEIAIHHQGVNHLDFFPRNIICGRGDLASATLQVVLIDFNVSVVRRLAGLKRDASDLPVSPIVRFWRGLLGFDGWIPRRADPKEKPIREWLWKHWGDSKLYQPVVRGAERPNLRPRPNGKTE